MVVCIGLFPNRCGIHYDLSEGRTIPKECKKGRICEHPTRTKVYREQMRKKGRQLGNTMIGEKIGALEVQMLYRETVG
jgi:hypothetical protein